ncbi:MAG: TIGR02221 family CRISPR-associated protein, partial [Pseudomonadota bacterium]
WEIFEALFHNLHKDDRVVFDITHAFRSIPMLALVVLRYAKVLKGVRLKKILYGAFESLGPVHVVRELPLDNRNAPILDLTPFDRLLDWTVAIDRFLGAGDAGPAKEAAAVDVRAIPRHMKKLMDGIDTVQEVAQVLEAVSKDMSTCRGPRIKDDIADLKAAISRLPEPSPLPAMNPLLHKLGEELAVFDGDSVRDGINAARWCLDHNLIQQGFTILQEFLKSHIATVVGVDPLIKEHREVVGQAVHQYFDNHKPPAGDNSDLRAQYLGFLNENPSFARIFRNLSQHRNDLNHAGFAPSSMPAKKFARNLARILSEVEEFISISTAPQNPES